MIGELRASRYAGDQVIAHNMALNVDTACHIYPGCGQVIFGFRRFRLARISCWWPSIDGHTPGGGGRPKPHRTHRESVS